MWKLTTACWKLAEVCVYCKNLLRGCTVKNRDLSVKKPWMIVKKPWISWILKMQKSSWNWMCRGMVLELKTDWDCLIYSLFGLQYTSGCVWNLGTQHGGTLQPSFSHSGAELGTVWWGACTPQGVKGRGFPGDASCAWCPSEAFTRPLAELIYSSL